mmetsp:Transcript_8887/g.29354  ORF Transcript_8887/g.29354 Transcript_8887/m.29354 type:complete len:107 (-) Transcript_8887:16-336(-)
MSGNLTSTFDVVRHTCNAHASAVDALERAFAAQMALLEKDFHALKDDRAAMMRRVDEKFARGEADLEEKRAAVERDRAEMDEEKAHAGSGSSARGEDQAQRGRRAV